MSANNSIKLTVVNKQEGLPVIFRNTSCELQLSLKNETGAEITFQQGKSSFQISIPDVSSEEIKGIKIIAENWISSINDKFIKLTYTGINEAKWTTNGELTFIISQIVTNAQPATGNIQVNPANFTPRLPLQLFTPIAISNPPKKGNADLKDVLQLSLDSGGVVYVSSLSENGELGELENELFLNVKNIGPTPLYTGLKKTTPKIEAAFVYGSSIGCLTPANKEEGGTFAWDIHASVPYKPAENSWRAQQPSINSGPPCPKWVLEPESTNTRLIGVGQNANVTFSFSEILAVTPPGHTQMILHFSGFMKDDTTAYDDALFILDIVKQEAPKERGIINFFSETPSLTVSNPKEKIKLTLKWSAYYVDRVDILIHSPVVRYWSKIYPVHHLPVIKDRLDIELNGILQDSVYLITIQAYDHSGAFLNSRQFSVIAKTNFFTDPRDGKTYPIITSNHQLWMAEDLKYVTSRGSLPAEKRDPDRIYDWEAAQSPAQLNGWRLPTCKDWEELIETYKDNPYEQLIKGGKSGFNAILNGMHTGKISMLFDGSAYYWAADQKGTGASCVVFDSKNKTVLEDDQKKNYYLSVRYVKDLDNMQ